MLLLLLGTTAEANSGARGLCALAAAKAESAHRLPTNLLQAMAAVESGWWPWAVRAGGVGYMPATRTEAVALVKRLRARGAKDIIVGCLQLNLRYHADAFDTLEEALEPSSNAGYAGSFLHSLYDGSWWNAVARYQGGTSAARRAYVTKVATVWQQAADAPAATAKLAGAKVAAKARPAALADAPFDGDPEGVLDLSVFPNLSFAVLRTYRVVAIPRARPDLL
jgi:hypothetical protein